MGFIDDAPRVDRPLDLILLIVNIFLPGIGTIIGGLIAGCNCYFVLIGILQILLVPVFLIGWIWSIYTGIKMYQKNSGWRRFMKI